MSHQAQVFAPSINSTSASFVLQRGMRHQQVTRQSSPTVQPRKSLPVQPASWLAGELGEDALVFDFSKL